MGENIRNNSNMLKIGHMNPKCLIRYALSKICIEAVNCLSFELHPYVLDSTSLFLDLLYITPLHFLLGF